MEMRYSIMWMHHKEFNKPFWGFTLIEDIGYYKQYCSLFLCAFCAYLQIVSQENFPDVSLVDRTSMLFLTKNFSNLHTSTMNEGACLLPLKPTLDVTVFKCLPVWWLKYFDLIFVYFLSREAEHEFLLIGLFYFYFLVKCAFVFYPCSHRVLIVFLLIIKGVYKRGSRTIFCFCVIYIANILSGLLMSFKSFFKFIEIFHFYAISAIKYFPLGFYLLFCVNTFATPRLAKF